ncbi:MAG: hypothetical protein JJ975_04530, partial [Bacteroidia bacterium]|nr:hypothetical protein [Bacteroidia bacterium]
QNLQEAYKGDQSLLDEISAKLETLDELEKMEGSDEGGLEEEGEGE